MALFQRSDRFRDLRNSPRYDVHYLAQIEHGGSSAPVSCIICDISGSGAKLTIGEQHQVPDEFTLLLRRRCRVVRRDDGQLGVQFV
jgi:hypothetical protein